MIRWAERYGYDLAYATAYDLHAGRVDPARHRGLVFPGRDEYWTDEMRTAVEEARERGTSLVFLSARTLYRRIELTPPPGPDRLLTCGRRRGRPGPALWRENDRAEQQLLGIQYAGPVPRPRPLIVRNAGHWLWEATGAHEGDALDGLVAGGADRYYPRTPLPAHDERILLAHSPYGDRQGARRHQETSLYRAPSGAWVFASGTLAWSPALDRPGHTDPGSSGPPPTCSTASANTTDALRGPAPAGPARTTPAAVPSAHTGESTYRPAPSRRCPRGARAGAGSAAGVPSVQPRGGTVSGFVDKPEPIQVPGLVHLHTGKVRELYRNEAGDLVMVASDRISAYDWVLPTEIPDKGRVLTQLSLWWFDQLADLLPNHVLSTDLPEGAPADWAGRTLVCKSLNMVPVECVARGYLTGSGLVEYNESRTVCGLALPHGLVDGSELPAPIFTPATKAAVGEHDENVSYEEVARQVGAETAAQLRQATLAAYSRARDIARDRGIILADTKFEFGYDGDSLVIADEVLTPDSSRFWPTRPVGAGARAAVVRQAVRPGLADLGRVGLGPQERAASAAAAAAGRGRHPGEVRGGVRAPDGHHLELTPGPGPGTPPAPGTLRRHDDEGPGHRPGPSSSERTTRFELATSTLARLRSTN